MCYTYNIKVTDKRTRMQKIKLLQANNKNGFEETLNHFIESVRDIKINQIALDTTNDQYTAVIIYEDDYWEY